VHRVEEDDIRALVRRLSRPHRSGGVVIERAAILAEGADATAVVDWILAHEGEAEQDATPKAAKGGGGLHGGRGTAPAPRPPSRFVLPAAALRDQTDQTDQPG
jgi:hypothetical protein